MDLSKLENQIREAEANIQDERKYQKALEIMELYSGADKVISSETALQEIQAQRQENGQIKDYLTGIPRLDALIGGFREGQLVVLSAPTGQGKTLFCQDLTRRFAEKEINCLWFNYEVGNEEFFERFKNQAPSFYLPRKIKGSSLEWLKFRILEGIAKFNTKVIFIDHLHFLLNMDDMAKAKNLSLLIGMLMRDLKTIAVRTNTIIFLVSHLRKTLMEKSPTIEDLRDSSFVAQESDIVMLLWRLKSKDKKNRDTGHAEYLNESRLVVEKNRRTGNLGGLKLVVNQGRFEEEINLDNLQL